jgi:hypothetical protein
LVANVILEAVINDNSNLRYLVGEDASMIIEARKNMSDMEFQNLIRKQINLLELAYLAILNNIKIALFFL